MPDGKLLAICNSETAACPDLEIKRNDTRLHTLNLPKTARFVAGLTTDASVAADIQAIGETLNCTRLGYYALRGTIRFPVFLGIAIYDGDLDAVINYLMSRDTPAIMLLPSIEDVPQAKVNAIKSKGSILLGLQDLQGLESLVDTTKAQSVFKAFLETQEDLMLDVTCELFPTPRVQNSHI
ncbi:MAG: hypothetical protein HRT36_02100 [Alphaproteobacteria bacterium]|nr:hypothetical protein [Alphaproteobacteria bacterium]